MTELARADRPQGFQSILERNGWLLSDQVLVSGFNFLTTAVLARWLGIHAFGVYSVFYIVLFYLNSIQLSLIASPMMTLAPQLEGASERPVFLRGMGTCQYLFSAACCGAVLLLPAAEKLHLLRVRIESGTLIAFILTILCFQAQDWLRRFWYTGECGKKVFFNDVISYAGQIVILAVLWLAHAVTVTSAFYAIALTSLAAFVAGARKEDVWGTLEEAWRAARKSWPMGRSLVVANQFQWLGSQGILLIVAFMVGVNAASGMRAAITLVGPVNILYQLLDNVIPVRAARAFQSGGRAGLSRYLRRSGGMLAALVAIILLPLAIFARPAMALVFGGSFAPYAHLLAWQAAYTMLALVYRGLQYYHRTMGTVSILAHSAMVVSVVSVTACVLLSRHYGATGGMAALVIGQALNVIVPLFAARAGKIVPATR